MGYRFERPIDPLVMQDILSYNKEQAVGDDEHNLITVIMEQFDMSLQEAIDKAGEMCTARMEHFYELYLATPRWLGPVDLDVQKLVDGMALCVSGVMHWSYESQRYFGKKGLEVKRSRCLHLLPKVMADTCSGIGPVPVDDSKI